MPRRCGSTKRYELAVKRVWSCLNKNAVNESEVKLAGLYLLLLWRQFANLGSGSEEQGGAAEEKGEQQELTANELIDRICNMWGPRHAWVNASKEVDGAAPKILNDLVTSLATMIVDTERRAALMLAYLRKFPMMYTPCCYQPMCFKVGMLSHGRLT
mmetsp:Transcript_8978/g.16250  ORF Transcript_8978/g.16250 Transcript_8978/m.16250 type:complete len:157 (+) Transcript_8978:1298-1768(+)